MAITTTMLREFRADFKETVKSLEEKYGIAVTINNISYTKDSFHFKTECCEVKAGENKEEADFKKYCRLYDFTEEDYNKSFTTFNGKRYESSLLRRFPIPWCPSFRSEAGQYTDVPYQNFPVLPRQEYPRHNT